MSPTLLIPVIEDVIKAVEKKIRKTHIGLNKLTVIEDVIKAVEKKIRKTHIGLNKLTPVYLTVCTFTDDLMISAPTERSLQKNAFTDDLMISAPTERSLQKNLKIWEEEVKKKSSKVNIWKTKVVVIGKENKQPNIKISQEKIDQLNENKYLGTWLEREGNM
ncbi:hypothetical protein QE152_g29049 [Popillia japonica]|uniref:Reverse transcriptase domain-containing protein n=1 Tax=Popillia japonica TaxID=7064 RepID=A0AAW1JI63_POPJA